MLFPVVITFAMLPQIVALIVCFAVPETVCMSDIPNGYSGIDLAAVS